MCMWYNIYTEKENERSRIVGKKSRKHERGEITNGWNFCHSYDLRWDRYDNPQPVSGG